MEINCIRYKLQNLCSNQTNSHTRISRQAPGLGHAVRLHQFLSRSESFRFRYETMNWPENRFEFSDSQPRWHTVLWRQPNRRFPFSFPKISFFQINCLGFRVFFRFFSFGVWQPNHVWHDSSSKIKWKSHKNVLEFGVRGYTHTHHSNGRNH